MRKPRNSCVVTVILIIAILLFSITPISSFSDPTNELRCSITMEEGPPFNIEDPVLYMFMFDVDNDPADNCQNHPWHDADTMYTVTLTKTGEWTIEKHKYREGWWAESTEASLMLTSSMPGSFVIHLRIPLAELPELSETLPWRAMTTTLLVMPMIFDFAPIEVTTLTQIMDPLEDLVYLHTMEPVDAGQYLPFLDITSVMIERIDDLIFIFSEELIPPDQYLPFVDIAEVTVERETDELVCHITMVAIPPFDLEGAVFYTFMFDVDNDPADNCQNHPQLDADTMYTVIHTAGDEWTVERATFQVTGQWWMVEETEASLMLTSSMAGSFVIHLRIPLAELPELSETLPWRAMTETTSVSPSIGDFAPDEGLAYLSTSLPVSKYAILIAPWRDGDSLEFKRSIHEMRLILLDGGWTDDNIIFLTRDDPLTKQVPIDQDEPWIDGDAYYGNLETALDAIAYGGWHSFRRTDGSIGNPQHFVASSSNSIVFIYLRDHGVQVADGDRPIRRPEDPDPTDEVVDHMDGAFCTYRWLETERRWDRRQTPENYWYDDEFAQKLNDIMCDQMILVVDTCHSGEFIRECEGDNRLIVTCCTEAEVSVVTAYRLHDRLIDPDADSDENGMISIEEAHDYAVANMVLNQHPQKSDQIDGAVYIGIPSPIQTNDCQNIDQRPHHIPREDTNGVLLNELFYNNETLQEPLQWVEIYNPTDTEINISNWILAFASIDGVNMFPNGTIVGSGKYLVVTHDLEAFMEVYAVPPHVTVIDDNEMGNNFAAIPLDSLRLYDETHLNVVDCLDYGGGDGRAPSVEPPNSVARYKGGFDTDNSEKDWYLETTPTPGEKNLQEKVSHDVAVIDFTTLKTIVGQGDFLDINVTVCNYGGFSETFNVTIYANTTTIETAEITLASACFATIQFTWDTISFAMGNYTLSAFANPILGETEIEDNTLIDGIIIVTILGDVDGDRDVDLYDIIMVCTAYGSMINDPAYVADYELTGDGKIDIYDILTVASNYGQIWAAPSIPEFDVSWSIDIEGTTCFEAQIPIEDLSEGDPVDSCKQVHAIDSSTCTTKDGYVKVTGCIIWDPEGGPPIEARMTGAVLVDGEDRVTWELTITWKG